ncbi:MAG: LEPR-XLL domain-containing protein, partial [Planctomycetota bacterium]|nr:LEPR-XLL domain-containing protein [Planctomycetota bacterium]
MDCRSKSYREEAYVEALEPRLLLAGSTGPVTHFDWEPISSPQTVDVPFTTTITAKDANDYTVTDFSGPVNLSGQTGPDTVVTIGTGTYGWTPVLYSNCHDARNQVIYHASEVGAADRITSLALNVTNVPGQVLNNWTIRMKHTALSAYSTYAWEGSGWTTVYQSNQTISAIGWTTFVFSTPFDYNGSSNLMVDFSFNNSSSSTNGAVQGTNTYQTRSMYYITNSGYGGDPLTWSGASPSPQDSSYIPNIRLNRVAPVAITPAASGSFVNGVWTGQVTVNQEAPGIVLQAVDGSSHVGTSNTFNVAYIGNLGVTVPTSVTEGNGVLAGQGTVTVSLAPTSDLTVTLASSDTTEATVPATVTILAGQTSATFDLTFVDDGDLDWIQNATITASSAGYRGATGTIAIHDNETAALTVTLPASATEGAGVLTGAGTVTVSAAPASNVTVSLTSSDTTELTVPATVTILAGQTSATFGVTIVNDMVLDGTQAASVTAHVENWTDGMAGMNVLDNESLNLKVWLPAQYYENQGVQVGAGMVSISGPLEPAADLVVALTSSDLTELTAPATVTIPAGQTSATFDLTLVDDALYDGTQTVTVTASAPGFVNGSKTMSVADDEVHHYTIDLIASRNAAGVPFSVIIGALDINNSTITVFTGTVALSAAGNGGAISVTPASTTAFVYGVWRGNVTVNAVDTNVVLTASDGAGHTVASNAFNVVVPSEIHGSQWCDLDGDGVWDAGELPLAGWTIFIDADHDGKWDAGEQAQVTDANGRYTFPYLAAGTYRVGEVVQPGWTQTHPGGAGTMAVTLGVGQVATGVDFANWIVSPSEIHGTKWSDLDGDGARDVNEPTLAGWTIYLDTNHNAQRDAGEPSQVTSADGQYAFTYLPVGTYTVGEVMPSGWVQTWPSAAGTTNVIVNGGVETGNLAGWTIQKSGVGNVVINDGSYVPASPDGPLPPYGGGFSALIDLAVGLLEFHSQEGWSVPFAPGSCVHIFHGPAVASWGSVPAGATDYGFEDIGGPSSATHGDADYDDAVIRIYDNDPGEAFLIWGTSGYSNSLRANGQLLMYIPSHFGAFTPPITVPIPSGGGTGVLCQDVVIPAGATASLNWVDRIRNFGNGFSHPDQEYRVEVRNTADQVLATVFSTNPGDALLQDWTARSADVSAFAGQTVRVAFVAQNSAGYFDVHIDDVSLTGTGGNWPIPVTLGAGQVVTGIDFGNRPLSPVPTAPGDLTATGVTSTQLRLDWSAASDPQSGVDHYNIYRDGTLLTTVPGGATTFTDTGLAFLSSHSYQVSAVNGLALEGTITAPVTGSPLVDTTGPTAPAALTATGLNYTQIRLDWSAASDPETGVTNYKVYRDGTFVGTVPAGQLIFTDSSLVFETGYSYAVSAVNGIGIEGAQATVSLTYIDIFPPTVASSVWLWEDHAQVVFGEPVEAATAQNPANYAITCPSQYVKVLSAVLQSDNRTV